MFHFTHGDAKHIASLLNDPAAGLQQLGITLVQQQASLIDKTFAFQSPQHKQLLSQMLQLINQYASPAQLELFLQAPGAIGFRVGRSNSGREQHAAPRRTGWQSQNAGQQRFGMVE